MRYPEKIKKKEKGKKQKKNEDRTACNKNFHQHNFHMPVPPLLLVLRKK